MWCGESQEKKNWQLALKLCSTPICLSLNQLIIFACGYMSGILTFIYFIISPKRNFKVSCHFFLSWIIAITTSTSLLIYQSSALNRTPIHRMQVMQKQEYSVDEKICFIHYQAVRTHDFCTYSNTSLIYIFCNALLFEDLFMRFFLLK